MYYTQGMMHDLSQSFNGVDDSLDMGKQGYASPFTDGYVVD